MNSETVDLIATDPPFNKGKDFHATPDSLAKGAKFQDRWSWERDVHEDWVDQITDDHPNVMTVIQGARTSYGDDMGAFLCFMAVRLLAMRRILKPTGSLYLHCDPTASHYLKQLMDAIFGRKNFRNEIVWCYTDPAGRRNADFYKRTHDLIYWYVKDQKRCIVNQIAKAPLSKSTVRRYGRYFDENGQVTYARLKELSPGAFKALKGIPDDLSQVWLDKHRGTNAADWWTDSVPVKRKGRGQKSESTGYPTQKPLSLYERLIETSSLEGDIVLDPFAGCATTLVAAEKLQRQWVGMDIWEGAHRLVEERLGDTTGLFGKVTFTDKPPARTDAGDTAAQPLRTIERRAVPLEPWQKLSRAQIVQELVEAQGINEGLVLCAGCGRELEPPFMELDHIVPRADRGENDISNRILLCRPCNGRKSAKLTMKGLIGENKKAGWMVDENAAKHARDLAHERYEDVRHGRSWPVAEKTGDLFA